MYPDSKILVEGLGVSALTGTAYAEAERRVTEAASKLAERGADALLLFGTSMSFYRGAAGNAAMENAMRAATGLPSMTLTSALEKAMRLLHLQRVAVATAYSDQVNALFRAYFQAAGFTIPAIAGLDLTALSVVEDTGLDPILDISRMVWARASGADALVISCAGLTTTEAAIRLEAAFRRPVISSSMVGAWAAQGLAGGATSLRGFGILYEQEGLKWPSA